MSLRKKRPVTPASRFSTLPDFAEITRKSPERRLLETRRRRGGRNSQGRVTVRHRGGGHRHHYRIIDFVGGKTLTGRVLGIEYDPNRSARIALVVFPDGEKRYILATQEMKDGALVSCGAEAQPASGNRLPLRSIPEGSNVCCLELRPGLGGKLVRSAGATAVLMAKTEKAAQIKLPSGEIRLFDLDCQATIGSISNSEHRYESLGKAGRVRWTGRRPKVRGVVMNPVDHPLGGGEGKSSGGRPPTSPWGKPEGVKTRDRRRHSRKMIVKRRK
ncbi:MAG TPA: 50S ribosomal protein L2 [bacterium]|uniref:Large ribosomal subunit protein uL2 n=1 Tax=candidate division TA06 bacterium ADurb.Bin417 TaxID=1852828 RepID=A0A1V5MHR9_UNCT6|nr:MAG: 50S ribosomal protein L2 [candidate division TA06 bacterium ADurb.Bin417]HNQ35334.1 50S ribosomal protein L2 [bacterium]HNS49295.1 50S ribosomal protein L2 [bacterium]